MGRLSLKSTTGLVSVSLIGGALVTGYLLVRHHPLTSQRAPIQNRPAGPVPSPPWQLAELQALLDAINRTAAEGLRPEDYQRTALQNAIDAGDLGPDIDRIATRAAQSLAHDFAKGHVRRRSRFNWYIDNDGPDDAALARQVDAARSAGKLGRWLTELLPTDPQYAALRDALASTSASDEARRNKIKVNLERWRWLPRDFSAGDQLYVNLPTYELEVRRNGQRVSSYNVVIGATDMPTPTISTQVRQVIVNPSWIVPPSIVRKSHLRPGASSKYVFTTLADGRLRVRQKPGAGNALGKVKIEFPNSMAIYFHDTPSRSLFSASERAFSHGCVRVEHIEELAGYLVDNDPLFTKAMASERTRAISVPKGWRANIVYLTMISRPGEGVVALRDPYRMDEALSAALLGRKLAKPQAALALSGSGPKANSTPPTTPMPRTPPPVATPTLRARSVSTLTDPDTAAPPKPNGDGAPATTPSPNGLQVPR